MKIYTRTGDEGTTSLFGGQRVSKCDPRVDTYGHVDELNSVIGLARAHAPNSPLDEDLAALQVELFTVGADLATPPEKEARTARVDAAMSKRLEAVIDRHDEKLEVLTRFILPTGCPASAALHLARTVCRRAERAVQALAESCEDGSNFGPVLVYLNRLSDLLFVLARRAAKVDPAGRGEVFWEPDKV